MQVQILHLLLRHQILPPHRLCVLIHRHHLDVEVLLLLLRLHHLHFLRHHPFLACLLLGAKRTLVPPSCDADARIKSTSRQNGTYSISIFIIVISISVTRLSSSTIESEASNQVVTYACLTILSKSAEERGEASKTFNDMTTFPC